MLNQKALELLDFVSDGKVRYPGYNAELFGDNVQVETKEEAEDRVYRFVTEEASSKLLLEYAKSIKGSGNPEYEIKTRPIYYDRDTYRYSDSYSESMKKECAEVIKSVTQKLINKIPDFAAEASKEENAAKKREIEEKIAEEKKEYNDYISSVSAKRTQLAQEAKDAGFESLLEYLMFLEVYETCLTSGSSGRCSLVNMFEHRKKNNRIIHNYQHCPLKKLGGLFFAQKQNFSAYCKKAVRLHRRKRELKKAARPCQL